MRVYYFTSSHWGLSNIKNKHLKVSSIENLNDPFDCFVHIQNGWRDDFRYLREQWNETLGMICFSRDYRNPVQWSHYADRHQGMVLGFDVDDHLLNEVNYIKEPYTVYFSSHEGTEEEWREVNFAMCCKFIDWSYEKESRVFFKLAGLGKDNGLHYKKFDGTIKLKEVILGVSCRTMEDDILEATLGFTGVEIRRAAISEDAYEVHKAIYIESL